MPYFVWPVPGFYRVTSRFRTIEPPNHMGIDIGRNVSLSKPILGADVVAVADGVVTAVGVYHSSKGNWLEICHGGGIVTRYMHNYRNLVKRGQHVRQCDVVAYVGSTGRSTAPHLHFEIIINGRHIDPLDMIDSYNSTLFIPVLSVEPVEEATGQPCTKLASRLARALVKLFRRK